MAGRTTRSAHRDLDTLFQVGIVGGLSDGQLLEWFANRREGAAEAAFEEVVRRHGPMVLGVCRRLLGDRHAADDAFQATFLVLALKAGSVRNRESLGPWLHGVAARVARRARQTDRGRKEVPLDAGELPAAATAEPAAAELRLVLDEELERLPEKYRRPVVLCYLEGQTQEEAARALGWTKGTISGRLARAKDLLRERLSRRGLAPTASVLAACLVPDAASAAVPAALAQPTIRAASAAGLAGMEAALGSGRAAALARGVIKGMSLGRLKAAVPALLLVVGATVVAAPRLLDPAPLVSPASRMPRRVAVALPSGERMRLGTTDRRHTAAVCDVAYALDGKRVVTAQVDGLIRLWDPTDASPARAFNLFGGVDSQDKALRAIAISPDGTVLAGVGFLFDPAGRRMIHGIWRWSLEEDRPLRTIEVDTLDLFCLAFSPEAASLATGDHEGKVQLWDVETGAELLSLDMGKGKVSSVVFSPDGMTLAASVLGQGVRLWDLGGGKDLGTLKAEPADQLSCPRFSPDDRLVAAGTAGGDVLFWDRAELRLRRRVACDVRGELSLAFSPDSRSLAVMGDRDRDLRLIDAETGRPRWSAPIGGGPQGDHLAFAPDGRTLVTVRGGALRYFDSATGRERQATIEGAPGSRERRPLQPGWPSTLLGRRRRYGSPVGPGDRKSGPGLRAGRTCRPDRDLPRRPSPGGGRGTGRPGNPRLGTRVRRADRAPCPGGSVRGPVADVHSRWEETRSLRPRRNPDDTRCRHGPRSVGRAGASRLLEGGCRREPGSRIVQPGRQSPGGLLDRQGPRSSTPGRAPSGSRARATRSPSPTTAGPWPRRRRGMPPRSSWPTVRRRSTSGGPTGSTSWTRIRDGGS